MADGSRHGSEPSGGVVTFGELLLRLTPARELRLEQASSLEVDFGGAEANVAVGLARLGVPSRFVSRVPDNPLAEAGRQRLRGLGVDTTWLLSGGRRLGLYFVEAGAAQRPSHVVYDRDGSGMATISPGTVPWEEVLTGWTWFHTSGVTPALSASALAVTLEGLRAARRIGLRTSADLNHRAKLWDWGWTAGAAMAEVMALTDIAFCNELDLHTVFDIPVPGTDDEAAELAHGNLERACRELQGRFPTVGLVAMTLRSAVSASHNRWSGILVDRRRLFTARSYEISPIVDRVGAGDAFAAATIARLLRDPSDLQGALEFAVAASCLKHSIRGDFNLISVSEAERLVDGNGRGRIVR